MEVATLIAVSLDLASTLGLAILSGHCNSSCCYGLGQFEHNDNKNENHLSSTKSSSSRAPSPVEMADNIRPSGLPVQRGASNAVSSREPSPFHFTINIGKSEKERDYPHFTSDGNVRPLFISRSQSEPSLTSPRQGEAEVEVEIQSANSSPEVPSSPHSSELKEVRVLSY